MRSAAPFGVGWQLEPDAFARWVKSEGVFGARAETPGNSAVGSGVGGPAVSATLGWLYLEQGHRDEAAEVFSRVLELSPSDARASEGLERISSDRLRERKIARLRAFLGKVEAADR